MNTAVCIVLIIVTVASVYGIWLFVKQLQLDAFKVKCRSINPPSGWNFYYSGLKETNQGFEVSGFIAQPPNEGGPSMKFLIPRRKKLGNRLEILDTEEGYILEDKDNNIQYKNVIK